MIEIKCMYFKNFSHSFFFLLNLELLKQTFSVILIPLAVKTYKHIKT